MPLSISLFNRFNYLLDCGRRILPPSVANPLIVDFTTKVYFVFSRFIHIFNDSYSF